MADKPVTREEKYLAYLTGDYKGELLKPITRKEKYLYELCLKGIGGEISPEEIKNAVNEYLEKNPVKPGATTEQAQQIEQNKKDVALLKEDLSNKITKFYASSQGETHLTDSDNGKIMDMMVHGKSEQKQYSGKNLLELSDNQVQSENLKIQINQGIITFSGTVNNAGFIKEIDSFIVPSNGTYTISTNSNSNKDSPRILFLINDNPQYGSAFNGATKELNAGDVVRLYIRISSVDSYDGVTIKPMIEKGSKVTSYEPYTGGKPSPSPDYPQEINSVVNPTVKISSEDGTKSQTVTLPYTLNAIPVQSGGNVTIDGQQYVADYVDVEREKLVRMVGVTDQDTFATSKWDTGSIVIYSQISNVGTDNAIVTISSKSSANWSAGDEIHHFTQPTGQTLVIVLPKTITTVEQGEEIRAKGFKFYYILITPIEIDLTTEEITSFKALATYYPTTNISVNSEQLDGYTVFNYPISMKNGWNYVKKQLNDNRDYIYDMDLQSAEAYVNSEYAVALTELEV